MPHGRVAGSRGRRVRRYRTSLRAAVAATTLALALTGAGLATAATDPVGDRGRHGGTGSAGELLSGSAETGSALAGSAAELAICALLEPVVPLPVCLLLV